MLNKKLYSGEEQMKKIIGLGVVLILLSILVCACQKKQEPTTTTPSIDEQEVLVSMEQIIPKAIPSKDPVGYDPARTEDFWIKGGSVIAMYAKDYALQDSIVVYHKDMPDSISRNAGYIKGTKYGNKVFFLEYYVNSEIGIEKYITIDDLVRDPRATEFWNRRIHEGVFETFEEAIEECACLDYPGSENTKNYILTKILSSQENIASQEIKQSLIEYTNLYRK